MMAATQSVGNVAETSRRTIVTQGIVLGVLVVVLYWSTVGGLVKQWWTDSDYSHGFIVVIFAGYLLWRSRGQWKQTEIRPSVAPYRHRRTQVDVVVLMLDGAHPLPPVEKLGLPALQCSL